ncbi:hypothetical protein [Mesorhizobium temperatum]|uniref:hypothetical protein n=1 Tax=Mesorhizobium temperatum TaxID=241416 RepID=UPI003CC92C7C
MPDVGGLQPREVLQILRGLDGFNIVGQVWSESHRSRRWQMRVLGPLFGSRKQGACR